MQEGVVNLHQTEMILFESPTLVLAFGTRTTSVDPTCYRWEGWEERLEVILVLLVDYQVGMEVEEEEGCSWVRIIRCSGIDSQEMVALVGGEDSRRDLGEEMATCLKVELLRVRGLIRLDLG